MNEQDDAAPAPPGVGHEALAVHLDRADDGLGVHGTVALVDCRRRTPVSEHPVADLSRKRGRKGADDPQDAARC
jgi:hypothetical protein